MKQRPLVVRIAVIANAILLVVAFAGCPARQDIMPPTIRPYGYGDQMPSPIAMVPPPYMPPAIAPPPPPNWKIMPPPIMPPVPIESPPPPPPKLPQ